MRSSIGAKIVMAVTGIVLFLYVIAHMLGNLQVFIGQDAINAYGALLRKVPVFLVVARAVLLASVVLHAISAVSVTRLNRAARPKRYAVRNTLEASYAARTLLLSGILIAVYVVYHIMHFTTRNVNTAYSQLHDAAGRHDIYSMVVGSFQNPLISIAYIVAMILVAMHVSHGIGGFMQTLGWGHPRYGNGTRLVGPIVATLIAIGYISIPVATLLGWIDLPAGAQMATGGH
jgi:succinate dehydrogenase / fumarate reductase cytochrome b subunit